jgi:D-alanyl-D-alanine dipeptidase
MRSLGVERIAAFGLGAVLAVALPSSNASPEAVASGSNCPADLATATRLIVVTATSVTSFRAQIELFERASSTEPWYPHGPASAAVVGRNGLAWGYPFRDRATSPQSIKAEGDRRTPAGVYRVGRPFGFEAQPLAAFLKLAAGESFCVDDPRSPQYNKIVPRKSLPREITGEEMRSIALYRHGLVIDYPSDARTKAGSCIFIHNWRSAAQGTAGCVAAPERVVSDLQRWASGAESWIAIYGKQDSARLKDCLKLGT